MKRRKKRKTVWRDYECRKRRLAQKALNPAQYEQMIQRIAHELKL